jgi:hypothetical protein
MNAIKRIKKSVRESSRAQIEKQPVQNETRWSKAVRSWVEEFHHRPRNESLPSFQQVFRDVLDQ